MKLSVLLAVGLSISSAYAEKFGGIEFDSSVPKDQSSALAVDLKYLYKNPNPSTEQEFLRVAKIVSGSGPSLHNWLINRVRYIIGENYDLQDETNISAYNGYKYPTTPLPIIPQMEKPQSNGNAEVTGEKDDKNKNGLKTVMSNTGGVIYLSGKHANILLGLKINNKVVHVTSPRIGVIQVGEGLFHKNMLINPDYTHPANSVSRLATLFHEARHSDGNGHSMLFMHEPCPKDHPYAGSAACEKTTNGSYTMGALAQKHLLKNCFNCSPKEIRIHQVTILDQFDRVLNNEFGEKIKLYRSVYVSYADLKAKYEKALAGMKPSAERTKVVAEVEKIKNYLTELDMEIKRMSALKPIKLPTRDDRPEGLAPAISMPQSIQLMEASLKR